MNRNGGAFGETPAVKTPLLARLQRELVIRKSAASKVSAPAGQCEAVAFKNVARRWGLKLDDFQKFFFPFCGVEGEKRGVCESRSVWKMDYWNTTVLFACFWPCTLTSVTAFLTTLPRDLGLTAERLQGLGPGQTAAYSL